MTISLVSALFGFFLSSLFFIYKFRPDFRNRITNEFTVKLSKEDRFDKYGINELLLFFEISSNSDEVITVHDVYLNLPKKILTKFYEGDMRNYKLIDKPIYFSRTFSHTHNLNIGLIDYINKSIVCKLQLVVSSNKYGIVKSNPIIFK